MSQRRADVHALAPPQLPDRAALQRALTPGTSHMKDATALLGWSKLEYGVIDESGVFQPQQDAATGPAARSTWRTRIAYVRGWGVTDSGT